MEFENVGSNRPSNYSSLGASIARSITDPRMVRVQRVRNSGVLDLQVEKFTNLNITPTSRYDLYLQNLRKLNSPIKQVGTPNDMDSRDIEVNTDDVAMDSKEVQFSYGDDTLMYQLIDAVRASKTDAGHEKRPSVRQLLQDNHDRRGAVHGLEDYHAETTVDFQIAGRLSCFLQKSSLIFDSLLQSRNLDNLVHHPDEGRSLFSRSLQRRYGEGASDGSLELIKYRKICHVNFCKKKTSMFLAYHPFLEDENVDNDLRPYKVISTGNEYRTHDEILFLLYL